MSISCRKMTQAAALAMLFVGFSTPSQAQWNVGNVFIGTGKGTYLRYTFNGTSYVLAQTITLAGSTDQMSGCTFDSQLNFYGTDTSTGQVFEVNGISQSVVPMVTGQASPVYLSTGAGTTSIMFDSSGNLYGGLGSVKGVCGPWQRERRPPESRAPQVRPELAAEYLHGNHYLPGVPNSIVELRLEHRLD